MMLSFQPNNRHHLVLVGNYGVGNVGDEALKEYFLKEFPDVEWTVVTDEWKVNPTSPRLRGAGSEKWKVVPRLPLGFRSLFRPWWRTLQAIRDSDALVFGGGSLFTDTESVWACLIWYAYTVVAGWYKKPVFLAFQGAGPWKTALGRSLSRRVYENAAFISVRDEKSLERLKLWTLRSKPVLTFDPAFALFAERPSKKPALRTLGIIPRANSDETFFGAVRETLKSGFDAVHIILMQPESERGVGERLKHMAPGATVTDITSVQQLMDEVVGASEIVTQRYHGALAALAMHVPFLAVPQVPGDKLETIQKNIREAPTLRDDMLRLVREGADALREALRGVSSL